MNFIVFYDNILLEIIYLKKELIKMKTLEIFNKDLIDFFQTNKITYDILSTNNHFNLEIPISSDKIQLLEELNKIVEYFKDVKCTISINSNNPNKDYKDDIIKILKTLSPNFTSIKISSFFNGLNLPENLMKKFIKLETLIIDGLKSDNPTSSTIKKLSLPPNLCNIKLFNIFDVYFMDTSQVQKPSDLVLFLDYFSLGANPQNQIMFGIENIDLSENWSVFDLNQLQTRFPDLKNLKMKPNYIFLGPLEPKDIEFLVKVIGQIQVKNNSLTYFEKIFVDLMSPKINGVTKIGNIYYDSKRLNLKSKTMSIKKYNSIKDKSSLKDTFLLIKIKNMSELSTEEAKKIKEIAPNCIISVEEVQASSSIYSLDDYILISGNLDKILSNVDPDSSQIEQYSQIYKALSAIYYNYDAIYNYHTTDNSNPYANFFALCLSSSSRNLQDALKYFSAVCAGFASVIHNACARQGIKSKINFGYFYDIVDLHTLQKYDEINYQFQLLESIDPFTYLIKDFESSHAWNMVKLDGIWYHSDITWDAERIREQLLPKYFLFSDTENLQRKCCFHSNIKCTHSLSSLDLAKLFPDLKPSPPIKKTVLSQEQHMILKKYSSETYKQFKLLFNLGTILKYKKMVKKHPILLPSRTSAETEPQKNISESEKNFRMNIQCNPNTFAYSEHYTHPDSQNLVSEEREDATK